jgi:quercetin dioxygenase-like cupin family protein
LTSKRYEDERGVIQDLLGSIDSVTEIFTKKDAIRGNHVHQYTTQWAYIVSGRLLVAHRHEDIETRIAFGPGKLIKEGPGVEHAWRALEDTTVLVFTKGPRSGENYEDDVIRLTGNDRLIQ